MERKIKLIPVPSWYIEVLLVKALVSNVTSFYNAGACYYEFSIAIKIRYVKIR